MENNKNYMKGFVPYAIAAAILSLCGGIQISGDDRYTIKIHTENVTVARKCFTLLKKTFKISSEVNIRKNMDAHHYISYSVVVTQKILISVLAFSICYDVRFKRF